MSHHARPRPKTATSITPDFAKSTPTNGFGEIEAIVHASLSSFGAPRPRPIATNVEKKMCKIFSPVSTGRAKSGSDRWLQLPEAAQDARPHTADAAIYRPRSTLISGDGANASRAPDVPEEQRRRPTSDTPIVQQRQRRERVSTGRIGGGGSSSSIRRDFKASVSGGGARHGQNYRWIDGGGTSAVDMGPPTHERREGERNRGSSQEGRRRNPHRGTDPPSPSFSRRRPRGSDRKHVETPPNRYWPSPGGPKGFLRPFIERNRKHLWAYDPALAGMDHVQAYRHIVEKGNFEAVKRNLLEKEDALVRGTGSFLMAETIAPLGGGTLGRRKASEAASVGGSESRSTLQRSTTAIEQDPFQFGGCNSDKRAREKARKRDLLVHAATRSNYFYRRKGYEPGDLLKEQIAMASLAGPARGSVGKNSRHAVPSLTAAEREAEARWVPRRLTSGSEKPARWLASDRALI